MSFVHYNVQSVLPKLDILHAELLEFDILAFTETWLSPTDNTDDLLLQSYNRPERKDRVDDSHGGVILYIKEGIHYNTGWGRTVHVSRCPALYSGRIFVPLCRELIIFVF